MGTNHYHWSPYSQLFENLSQNVTPDNFESQLKKLAEAKRSTYAKLSVAVQAEPYNPADENAIAVMIENIDSKLEGNPALEKVGYLRATAAKILRAVKPEKMTFNAKLVQISERDIVVQIEV